ncbi:MAG: threonylcarbamoyl-AMP synthase [Deltaproteobacteria bacterium]|nr:threonylcarbamoyl-AMP synthase [Deltaproteobacteria bacterium]
MNPEVKIRKIDPGQPRKHDILEAARIVCSGGVVVFPTTSLYGLAADAANHAAVESVFAIKQRPPDKPILILVPNRRAIQNLVLDIPLAAERIMTAFWPGNLTLIFKAGSTLLPSLTAGTGKIGIRLPVYPVARLLVRAVGRPITATSANISGRIGCSRIADLDPAVAARVDLILDAGPLKGGSGSTILDVSKDPPVLLREGSISQNRILSVLQDR